MDHAYGGEEGAMRLATPYMPIELWWERVGAD